MSTYQNRNEYGQAVGRGSIAPHNIQVSGSAVSFEGEMSRKAFDMINMQGLVVYHRDGERPFTLHCRSAEAAQQVAAILAANPNYPRNGAQ